MAPLSSPRSQPVSRCSDILYAEKRGAVLHAERVVQESVALDYCLPALRYCEAEELLQSVAFSAQRKRRVARLKEFANVDRPTVDHHPLQDSRRQPQIDKPSEDCSAGSTFEVRFLKLLIGQVNFLTWLELCVKVEKVNLHSTQLPVNCG
ncbi:hypothetical protein B0H17DRAFT_1144578 [Mycena rosella]|uniref:Uncharacterized protein n=1 Tax=Mycena rosella TaxID=1033263 RepID=A0AAD7G6K9_MYCRO|nr:hypothetical protein B0H17DRAFT_1144578 [Mycena rosella]